MPAKVTCTECGMVLEVYAVANYYLAVDRISNYYHIPNLNEHMQLHEGA